MRTRHAPRTTTDAPMRTKTPNVDEPSIDRAAKTIQRPGATLDAISSATAAATSPARSLRAHMRVGPRAHGEVPRSDSPSASMSHAASRSGSAASGNGREARRCKWALRTCRGSRTVAANRIAASALRASCA